MADTAPQIEIAEPAPALPQIQLAHIDSFTPSTMNAKLHPPEQIEQIAASIREFGWTWPILRRGDTTIGAGHGRREAAKLIYSQGGRIKMWNGFELPLDMLPWFDCSNWSETQFKAYMLADNRIAEKGVWDLPMLQLAIDELKGFDFDLPSIGFGDIDITELFGKPEKEGAGAGSLAARFGVPPFSVLNAREGWWQDRKAAWLALGIRSEVGRGENLLAMSDTALEPDPIKRAKMQAERAARNLARDNAVPGGGGGGAYGGRSRGGEGYQTAMPAGLTHGEIPNYDGAERTITGTSIFDPVLCELSYRWFCPQGGIILDPFAGGSVRGVVAGKLGRRYIGVDLRPEQIEANRAQGEALFGGAGLDVEPEGEAAPEAQAAPPDVFLGIGAQVKPEWVQGDSLKAIPALASAWGEDLPTQFADFVFSCPPYGDLEVYSDAADDLSAMEHADFLIAYRGIIKAAVDRLKPDRFAAMCVGDFRDGRGLYRNFVSDTIAAFQDAGAMLYNEAILVTAVGSLPIRASRQFQVSRKLGKTHQNVLVFVKGDPRKAVEAIGDVEMGEPSEVA